MKKDDLVLILTQEFDPHADRVIAELERRGQAFFRFDTADFPLRATLRAESDGNGWTAVIDCVGQHLPLSKIKSIWYRRPRSFDVDSRLSEPERKFARSEALMAVGGILRSVDCLWINHPEKLASANYKPYQLSVASRAGLTIPRTLVTNDPGALVDFFERCGGNIVCKALSFPVIVASDERSCIYTSVVTKADLRDCQRVAQTACLFQEHVPKLFELRITVVGNRLFAAEIHTPEPVVDWREHYAQIRYAVHDLPPQISASILRMTEQLGLVFAAIDMIVTPDGNYVFIELNPNGQWAWIQTAAGLPICEALVDCLNMG